MASCDVILGCIVSWRLLSTLCSLDLAGTVQLIHSRGSEESIVGCRKGFYGRRCEAVSSSPTYLALLSLTRLTLFSKWRAKKIGNGTFLKLWIEGIWSRKTDQETRRSTENWFCCICLANKSIIFTHSLILFVPRRMLFKALQTSFPHLAVVSETSP